MNSDLQSWIPIVAFIAAGVFVLQVVAVIFAVVAVRKVTKQVEEESKRLEKALSTIRSRLIELTDGLEPVRGVARDLALNMKTLSGILQKRAAHADEFLDQVISAGQEQVAKVDYLISDTIEKFGQSTEMIQKDLLKPAVEISSIVKGIRSALGMIFPGKKRESSKAGQEEDLFI